MAAISSARCLARAYDVFRRALPATSINPERALLARKSLLLDCRAASRCATLSIRQRAAESGIQISPAKRNPPENQTRGMKFHYLSGSLPPLPDNDESARLALERVRSSRASFVLRSSLFSFFPRTAKIDRSRERAPPSSSRDFRAGISPA